MISDGGSASGKPAEEDQSQEIFKLRMERDAYRAQYAAMVKENKKLSASNAALQFSQDHKTLLLQNALELIKKFQLELYGKSSEKSRSLDAYCQNLFDEVELLDLVGKQNQEEPIQQDESESPVSEETQAPPKARKTHKKHELATLPADTPVIDVDHTHDCIAPIDPNTGKRMVQVGIRIEPKVGK